MIYIVKYLPFVMPIGYVNLGIRKERFQLSTNIEFSNFAIGAGARLSINLRPRLK